MIIRYVYQAAYTYKTVLDLRNIYYLHFTVYQRHLMS